MENGLFNLDGFAQFAQRCCPNGNGVIACSGSVATNLDKFVEDAGFCCQVPADPALGGKAKGLRFRCFALLTQREQPELCCRLQLA